MIIAQEDIDKAILAGKIASKSILYGKSLIKPGVRVVEVLDKIEEYILAEGGRMAFPAQMAINEIAAHDCPLADDTRIIKDTDIVKLDLGVHMDGFIADNALTIIFPNHENHEQLQIIKKASDEALKNALNIIKPGITLGEIGLMIQETIAKYDLSPIRNLSGHGLGKYSVHESPTVPNFNTGDRTELEENQMIAIEPFATNGQGSIYESNNPTIFQLHKIKPVRSQFAREVLSQIQTFEDLPFTTRWLTKGSTLAKVNFGLRELKNAGILMQYPPLIESGKGMVSQSEHTVIVREKPIITTLRDE